MISSVNGSLKVIKFSPTDDFKGSIIMNRILNLSFILIFILCSCAKEDEESTTYSDWTVVGSGLSAPVTKKVLTEFVGSTNCPYCPATDALLLSYFDSWDENYVGTAITDNWFLINYHTYSPARGDPMYEFHRGATAEEDFCYVRFEEGSWYTIYGVPTTYTNGTGTAVYPEMAVAPMAESTPLIMSLDGTTIDGAEISVQVSISSSRDMTSSDSLHLYIAATLDNVDYTGANGEPHHQDVFLGWINDGLSGELLALGHEEVARTYSWTMPSNWPQNDYETSWSQVEYDVSNLAVVAFIQNKYTKEVVQVAGAH